MAAPSRYESLRDEELGASAPGGAPPAGGPAAHGWPQQQQQSGWGAEDDAFAGVGAAVRRDWRGGLFQCVGACPRPLRAPDRTPSVALAERR